MFHFMEFMVELQWATSYTCRYTEEDHTSCSCVMLLYILHSTYEHHIYLTHADITRLVTYYMCSYNMEDHVQI